MAEDLEDLKRRLVVGHKRDGRSVYDEAAKAELVALCLSECDHSIRWADVHVA